MSTTYDGRSWFAADTFLNGGRNPDSHRNFGKTRCVHRLPNGDIAVRLHQTDVVTYHQGTDDWMTIYMGGWDTVTTKSDIRKYAGVSVCSTSRLTKVVQELAEKREGGGGHLCVYEPNAPTAPPREWECRTCSGHGQRRFECSGTRRDYCWEGRIVWMFVHSGTGDVCAEDEIPRTERWNGQWERLDYDQTMSDPCRHGQDRSHVVSTPGCHHGYIEPHLEWVHCYRCNGDGVTDYGSEPTPTLVDPYRPFLVDGDGRVLAQGSKAIHDMLSFSLAFEAKRRIHKSLREFARSA